MINKLKINFFDFIIFTISLIFFLVIYTTEDEETYSRVSIYFPHTPAVFIDEIDNHGVEFSLSHPDKFYLPVFSKNIDTLEIDSRATKLNKFCKDDHVRIFNWDKNVDYFTFTMDTTKDGENIDSCFLKLKKHFENEWEVHKDEHIFYLNEAMHSLSRFSYFWNKNAQKHFKDHNHVGAIRNGCEKYYELPKKFLNIKKIYFDLCGNFVDLEIYEKKSNIKVPIDKEVYFELAKDFEKRGLRNYYSNGNIKINIYEDENLDLEKLFSKENFNKDFIRIEELLMDREYMDSFITINNETDYYINLKISRENIDRKKLLIIEENLSKNLSALYLTLFENIMDHTEEYIFNLFLNSQKKIFVPEEYKNSKLVFKKSENYKLSSSKTFYSPQIFFFSVVSAVFIVLIFKLFVNYIKARKI